MGTSGLGLRPPWSSEAFTDLMFDARNKSREVYTYYDLHRPPKKIILIHCVHINKVSCLYMENFSSVNTRCSETSKLNICDFLK